MGVARTPMTVMIRPDGGPAVGLGHLVRTSALGEGLVAGGARVIFVLEASLAAAGRAFVPQGADAATIDAPAGGSGDADRLLTLARAANARHAILDGYRFGATYRDRLMAGGLGLTVIDDLGDGGPYRCDRLVNAGFEAERIPYDTGGAAPERLLGPGFALLRRTVRQHAMTAAAPGNEVRQVAITLGGGRSLPYLAAVFDAAAAGTFRAMTCRIVVGPADPDIDAIARRAASCGVAVERGGGDFISRLAAADLVVSAAGTTVYELLALGRPAILIETAANQRAAADYLGRNRLMVGLGPAGAVSGAALSRAVEDVAGDRSWREQAYVRGRALIDGLGARRVADRVLAA